jgi:hypothetical protein
VASEDQAVTPDVVASLAIAVVTVVSAIGAVLLLAFRVGRLTGALEQRLANGETDRSKLWEAIGALVAWRDRHVEQTHRGTK